MYLTLPSNASQNIYAENTTSDFTVHLPKTLDFVGPWEVALVEFCYPNSWYNLSGLSNYYLYYRQNAVSATASIPAGYYQNPRSIIQHQLHDLKIKFQQNLDDALAHSSETYVTEPIKFQLTLQYNEFTQKVSFQVKGSGSKDYHVQLSEPLARIFGFEQTAFDKPGFFEGNRVADLNPINLLFIYSNLTTPVVVGDCQAQLLATIPVKGKAGEYISRRYEKLRYLPLLSNTITDVHISIRDDQGEKIQFQKGKSLVVLHFRRQKLQHI